jgi:predicted DCC family thiol-disulfide oxidoreductase YuxK
MLSVQMSHSGDTDRRQALVLYDADCGFCRSALALLLQADRQRRLRPLALGTPAADELLADLTPEQRAGSWHLVMPDGSRSSAGAALAPLLALLPGGSLPAAVVASIPGPTERGYRWVAEHRSKLSRWVPSGAKRRATALIARRSAPMG